MMMIREFFRQERNGILLILVLSMIPLLVWAWRAIDYPARGQKNIDHTGAILASGKGRKAENRALDLVLCIDGTRSSQAVLISLTERAIGLSTHLNNALDARKIASFDHVRVRAIYFRDFVVDGPAALVASPFYPQPGEALELKAFMGSQKAFGGGDNPNSGYECLHEAMSSEWLKPGTSIPGTSDTIKASAAVIVMLSDADAHPLGHGAVVNPTYPAQMPLGPFAFLKKWNNPGIMPQGNRVLIQFGPCNSDTWALARDLGGYRCGGSIVEGVTDMIPKIADALEGLSRQAGERSGP